MQGVVTLDQTNFDSEVMNSSTPVAVDFWAEWCGPCRMLSPIIEQVAADMGDTIKIGKCNVDENPNLSAQYGIRSIPTVLIFKGGQVVDQFSGVRTRQEIVDRLKKVV